MQNLLTVTAVIECAAGLLIVALPSPVATLLLGSSLDAPAALTLARVAGVALLALGVACWLARHDGQSRAARGLAGAMVLYNAGVAIILAYGGVVLGLSGIGLWPTVLLHAGHDRVVPHNLALKR
jgi:hypothetical protein